MNNYIDAITSFIFLKDNIETLKKADAIMLPGATRIEIPEYAAKLFFKGYGKYIFTSGKYSSRRNAFPLERVQKTKYNYQYTSESEFLRKVLLYNKVPNDNIISEYDSRNTMENALMTKELIDKLGISINSAIVCCQAFHARRVQITYSSIFKNTDIYICPIETQGISRTNWFKSEKGIRTVLGELERCGKYFTKNLIEQIGDDFI